VTPTCSSARYEVLDNADMLVEIADWESRVTGREVVGGPVARLFNDGDRPAVAEL
jgi:hypothetical protein